MLDIIKGVTKSAVASGILKGAGKIRDKIKTKPITFDTDKTIDESLLKLNRSNMEFKENSKLIPEALDE